MNGAAFVAFAGGTYAGLYLRIPLAVVYFCVMMFSLRFIYSFYAERSRECRAVGRGVVAAVSKQEASCLLACSDLDFASC